VVAALRKMWKELVASQPGHRFQDRYRSRSRTGSKGVRVLKLAGGLVLIVAGIVLLFVPGPGSVLLVVGAALLGQESLVVARMLDRSEVRATAIVSAALRKWRSLSAITKIVLSATAASLVASVAWAAYTAL